VMKSKAITDSVVQVDRAWQGPAALQGR
jgi:hypothetical protein